ncbi:MAG: glycosyltransferase family 4 protein [Candidatus Eiseniibacteriota bacterium]
MRVLLVNAFHYLRGGVERTYLDESRWLEQAGHEVIHFATRDPRNQPSPTARHFAPAADFGETAATGRLLTQLPRAVWSRPAARAMDGLLREMRPDIAHLHAPSRYLTPAFLRPLERAGVPVVMTLHDFKPWCTNRILFARGAPCERCRGGHHWHALTTGCVQDSRARSAVAMVEAYAHGALTAYRAVRRWIAPSAFVLEKAVEHGVPRGDLRLLPHGVEPGAGAAARGRVDPYVFFSGRLSTEKGVRLLPPLAAHLEPIPVLVAGEGPLMGWLGSEARSAPNLRLLGHVPDAVLADLRAAAAVVVVPSLFYEHFCYAVAEALLDRRPVVASAIGAIPELVEHEVTGLLVPPGDAGALGDAVDRALIDPAAARWGEAGGNKVAELGEPRRHVEGLLSIYRETMDQSPGRASPRAEGRSA